jgi:hypothetical protein
VGCSSFWEVLEQNATLKRLDMSGCGMNDVSAKVLIENMEHNHSIAYYDFSFNNVRTVR